MSKARSEPEPRYVLDAKFRPDQESHLQPLYYEMTRKARLPLIHPRPWSALGAPGARILNDNKRDVDKFVYLSTRRINLITPIAAKYTEPPLPKQSHSEMINFPSCPAEYDDKQILDRSSPHIYPGKYVKPQQYTFTADGLQTDQRRPWRGKRPPMPVNIRAEAGSVNWSVNRPSTASSKYQMGYYFTHRS